MILDPRSESDHHRKFNHFYSVTPCPCQPNMVDIHRCIHELSDRQPDTQTDTDLSNT